MADTHEKESFALTDKNRVRRLAKRGAYDKETIHNILDAGTICYVGFNCEFQEEGQEQPEIQPIVLPMIYGRQGDLLYLHGNVSNNMNKHLAKGCNVCVNVTLVNGYVVARSVFHNSMNYRSAVLFGKGHLVTDEAKKLNALRIVSEHLIKGKWDDSRQPTQAELKATSVIELDITSASAKIREGPPLDDKKDVKDEKLSHIWAGVVPIKTVAQTPINDPTLKNPNTPVPNYILDLIKNTQH